MTEKTEELPEQQSADLSTNLNHDPSAQEVDSYWHENLKLLSILLSIWFLVSFGCGILFVDFLNQFSLFGFKLGFWFAQQGSILMFILLIVVYAVQMRRIERRHHVDD